MNREQQAPPLSKLVDLKQMWSHPLGRWLTRYFATPLELTLSIDALNAVYHRYQQIPGPQDFFTKALQALSVEYTVAQSDREKIPRAGSLVIVANHPYGGVEGIILGHLLNSIRADVKILGNFLLDTVPDIRAHLVSVDPFGRQASVRSNAAVYKQSIRHVAGGGALVVFPAGEVAHWHLRQRQVTDSPWSAHIGRLIRHTQARVLPVYFPGCNSLQFHLLGLLNPRLRTVLLPRELTNKQHRRFDLLIGKPIPWARMASFTSAERLTGYLRFHTDFLANRPIRKRRLRVRGIGARSAPKPNPVTIAPSQPVSLLCREVDALPRDQLLVQSLHGAVYIAKAHQIPVVLQEICRLRELTFRQAMEGTQQASDRDRYDDYYWHLFLWNHQHQEVVGAYRLGVAREIVKRYGSKGLYAHSLFHFDAKALAMFGNAVELGRSFVRPEYQRKHTSLTLLWRGIGEFVVRHPHIRTLFGAVSISQDYRALSRDLLIRFLSRCQCDPQLAARISPRKPYRASKGRLRRLGHNAEALAALHTIEDISFLVSELEKDGKGVPILIRHYLKLNAKFIHFNVDRHFSNVVDGLIVVDLTQADPRILQRFMGKAGWRQFQDGVQGRTRKLSA
jgi:putative hemolysin